ncbi:hypothetical protein [Chitinophaga defluvii]|uniref:Uncharacterized protein n=1 Tax=Chitinophaga defluvii TaxID=3163343 RepID=A0ABV2T218_9BACT
MDIVFTIETPGYIVAEFSVNETKVKIGHSSSYGDRFQELLNKFFHLYEVVRNNEREYFPYTAKVLWEDDFINYTWSISVDSVSSDVEIKIHELSPSNSDYKVELVNRRLTIEDLFNNIYYSLDGLLVNFGFVGYKKAWEVGNFPIFEYLTLKAGRESIQLHVVNSSDDEQNWTNKIDIEEELNLISLKGIDK